MFAGRGSLLTFPRKPAMMQKKALLKRCLLFMKIYFLSLVAGNCVSKSSSLGEFYTTGVKHIVYALMYLRAKCLLKGIFLFIPFWNIIVMRKKRIAFFSNSLNL